MKDMIRDAAVLLLITLIAGAALGLVYQVTKAPIEEQEIKAQNEACTEVFGDAADFEEIKDNEESGATDELVAQLGFAQVTINKVLAAKDNSGNILGYVLSIVSHEGYAGDIGFYMGVQKDGTLNGISILSIAETPGLGMKAESVLVPQFEQKQVEQFSYTNEGKVNESEIDAISGATITTAAVTNGVNAGLAYIQSMEGGID